MDTLILENFRCFAGRHEVPLRPLTLLVGENSTGKTSFLAAVKLVHEIRNTVRTPDFNEEPFALGSFDEIAHNRGKATRPSEFKLGFLAAGNLLEGTFHGRNAQPVLTAWSIVLANGPVITARPADPMWLVTSQPRRDNLMVPLDSSSISLVRTYLAVTRGHDNGETALWRDWSVVCNELGLEDAMIPFSGAPVRAEPKRTYDFATDRPKPQGNHVPILLSQIYGKDEWIKIECALSAFARAAGLFEKITVKKLANGEGGPFQLHVRLAGHSRNIIDVGYGVSQILPVVFDAIRGPKKQLYMFEQPEVHLHPRAQAELASLFGSLVKAQHKQFLVETHSDHFLDRVRLDVRDKNNIGPDDVVILYFERRKDGVKIFPIFLDEMGNLLDVPPTYRRFFLEEERRYWGLP